MGEGRRRMKESKKEGGEEVDIGWGESCLTPKKKHEIDRAGVLIFGVENLPVK